jgi:hypothetical protein
MLPLGVDMKKIICIALTAMALILVGTSYSDAFRGGHGGHGGHVGVGVFVGPGWGPGWWGPYPYYPYYPYYSTPPVVIEKQPDTYIQKAPQDEQPSYWYFCKDPEGYYPYVKKCPKGWLKVLPSPSPEGEEE